MILVTIDLVPGGILRWRSTIAAMRIANIADRADISNYEVDVIEVANPLSGTGPRNGACTVENHDRNQSVFALIARAAEAAMKAEYDDL